MVGKKRVEKKRKEKRHGTNQIGKTFETGRKNVCANWFQVCNSRDPHSAALEPTFRSRGKRRSALYLVPARDLVQVVLAIYSGSILFSITT